MSEKNSLNSFDQLSTEILFEIFDYLSSNDIIYAFLYLNQRFHSILLQYLQFLKNFATPTNHFSFWHTILPIISSQIKCLTITTLDFSFSLDSFPNLKSLIISCSLPIYYDELAVILESEQFKKLNSFQIKSEIVNESDCYERPIFEKVLRNENSLHIFESLLEPASSSFTHMNNLKINVNLQSLSLKVLDFICLFSILHYTPNLKYLSVLLTLVGLYGQSIPNIDLSHIKLKKISIVTQGDGIHRRSFPILTQFIKQFSSSLIYLSLNLYQINTNDFQFNGFTLQQQFLESMIQLKLFHLYTKLNIEPMNVESLLSTFQTQFWFDHHWSIGTHGTYLYTLPFHFDKLKDFIDFDQIKSSNSKIFNSPRTWSHVKWIDFSESFKFSSNVIEQLKLKMPNLTSTTFSIQLMNNLYTNDNGTNQTDITLDNITTVYCLAEHLQIIKQGLINIFPNTRHLVLSYDPQLATSSSDGMVFLQKFDEYFGGKMTTTDYIYSSRIHYLEVKVMLRGGEWGVNWDTHCIYPHVICPIEELLEMFGNLPSFIFHFYHIPRFATRAFTDLSKITELLKMRKLSEKYHIKHIHNYLQFVRKNDD